MRRSGTLFHGQHWFRTPAVGGWGSRVPIIVCAAQRGVPADWTSTECPKNVPLPFCACFPCAESDPRRQFAEQGLAGCPKSGPVAESSSCPHVKAHPADPKLVSRPAGIAPASVGWHANVTVVRLPTVAAVTLMFGLITPAPAVATPPSGCDDPSCVPGITGGVVLGASCSETAYYVFGTTSWGRLVFCGSPRRYAARYFRSPPLVGIRDENSPCSGFENDVAQARDGLFLTCVAHNSASQWIRGDV